MATIVDPDNLTLSNTPRGSTPTGSIYFDVANLTFQIISSNGAPTTGFASSGFNDKEGVNLQALYSFFKQQWKTGTDPTTSDPFVEYLFPMEAITAEQFEFINGWEPADDLTRRLIRTGGWTEKTAAGVEKQSWMGVITLGNIGASQEPYYAWYDDAGSEFITVERSFTETGVVNEPLKIYGTMGTLTDLTFSSSGKTITTAGGDFTTRISDGDYITVTGTASNNGSYKLDPSTAVTSTTITLDSSETLVDEGTADASGVISVDYRDDQLFTYIRPAPTGTQPNVVGYTFDSSSTDEIGAGAGVVTQVYRFPLTTSTDPNITLNDSDVTSLISSAGLQITFDQTFASSSLPLELDGGPFNFTHIISSTNGDPELLTPSEVYNFVQNRLRQPYTVDIDADGTGVRNGSLTEALVQFVGAQLQTFAINGGTEGVVVDNFDTNDTENFAFTDNTNTLQKFPTISSGNITFNIRAIEDPATRYWMFYQTANSGANVFPGGTALIVNDQGGNPITGYLHIQSTANASETQNGSSTGGNITAGSSVLTSATGGLTPSALVGQVLNITAGNNEGFWFITANTANTITIDGTFENTDAAFTVTWASYTKNTTGVVGFTFDYSNAGGNRNDGLSDAQAAITLVTLGLENAQYVTADGTIDAGPGNNFPVNPALERNYSDPV